MNIAAAIRTITALPKAYSGLVAFQIRRCLLEGKLSPDIQSLQVDQMQSNGSFAVHQLRVTLPDGMGTYRVIVAPADAPIFIGKCPADEHFNEPLVSA
jgi:hypothetical protein